MEERDRKSPGSLSVRSTRGGWTRLQPREDSRQLESQNSARRNEKEGATGIARAERFAEKFLDGLLGSR